MSSGKHSPLIALPDIKQLQPSPRVILLFLIGALAAGTVIIGLFFFSITAFTLYSQASGRIYPGVSTAGLDLGWMQIDQAAVLIHRRWALEQNITVTDGVHQLVISPGDLGIMVDALATADTAWHAG